MSVTVVYGDKATGKTLNAELIKKHVGAKRIVDDYIPGHEGPNHPIKDGDLVLTYFFPEALKTGDDALIRNAKMMSIKAFYSLSGFIKPKKLTPAKK